MELREYLQLEKLYYSTRLKYMKNNMKDKDEFYNGFSTGILKNNDKFDESKLSELYFNSPKKSNFKKSLIKNRRKWIITKIYK